MISRTKQKFLLAVASTLSLGVIVQNIDISSNANIFKPVANAQDANLEASLSGAGASFPALYINVVFRIQ